MLPLLLWLPICVCHTHQRGNLTPGPLRKSASVGRGNLYICLSTTILSYGSPIFPLLVLTNAPIHNASITHPANWSELERDGTNNRAPKRRMF